MNKSHVPAPALALVEEGLPPLIHINAYPGPEDNLALLSHKTDWVEGPTWTWNEKQVMLVPAYGSVADMADAYKDQATLPATVLNELLKSGTPMPAGWFGKIIYFLASTYVKQDWRSCVFTLIVDPAGVPTKRLAMFADRCPPQGFIALYRA